MSSWRTAMMLPTVIDSAARIHSRGPHKSRSSANAWYDSVSSPTNPAVFETTDRYAVTGVGAPS